MSVDGTFLTGQFKGTLLTAVANDGGDKLVPLAFALVSVENNPNWEWFLHLVRTKVIGPQREVCIISDRHPGILNAMKIDIPGHARVHHRWCMRHFVSNFYRACGDKELSDLLHDCCLAFTTRHFEKLWDQVYAKANNGGKDFLNNNLADKGKWARAFDDDGVRYGDMTNNMAECFNMVLKGIRALPVTAIVEYTFQKLNAYFQKYSEETTKLISGKNKAKKMYKYPRKIDDWMEYQARKADSHKIQSFDNIELIYQVDEHGGMSRDGVPYGGASFKVYLKRGACSCERPTLYHLPCSHLMAASRTRNLSVNMTNNVRLEEYSIDAVKNTWAARFHPYLDQSKWPEYHGPPLYPDPEMKVVARGRRKTKRFLGDMDDWGGGFRKEWGNQHFVEPRDLSRCGECNNEGHNTTGCSKRKRSKRDGDAGDGGARGDGHGDGGGGSGRGDGGARGGGHGDGGGGRGGGARGRSRGDGGARGRARGDGGARGRARGDGGARGHGRGDGGGRGFAYWLGE